MNEMYSKYANKYAEAIKNNIYNSLYDRPTLLSLLKDDQYSNCLDMGTGPGEYIPQLKKFCQNITALDLSSRFIEMIQKNYSDVKSYVWDINNGLTREQNETFDLVVSPLTIHYVEDHIKLFEEVNRVLNIGGTFAFSTHHPFVDLQDSPSQNYFSTEKLTQTWNTLGEIETEVSFYRRPLTDTINSLLKTGFNIAGFSEGKPSEKIKDISADRYKRLTTKPQFLFIKAQKV